MAALLLRNAARKKYCWSILKKNSLLEMPNTFAMVQIASD